jgi:DNA-binding NarL/FixJ family response regulator
MSRTATGALLSDRRSFRTHLAALARARGAGPFIEFTEASALFRELSLRPEGIVVVDLDHQTDDPFEIVREVRARWPDVQIAAIGGPPDHSDGWLVQAVTAWDARPLRAYANEPAAAYGAMWSKLTRRQREVLAHLGEGEDNLKIAACLGISERAVKAHVSALLHVFAAENRTQLALLASRREIREHG